jgi:hypothetical protein
MNDSRLLSVAVTVLFVFGAVVFRLAFGTSQLVAGSALGRFKLPKSWQRWLFGEDRHTAAGHR